jgi:hypothetical protein
VKLRTAARGIAIVSVLLAVIAVRVVSGSRGEYLRGEQLLAAGDPDGAIIALRRAARWYTPGNPYCGRALDRLYAIGVSAERANDAPRALAAYRSIHGAIWSSRSFYVPHRERLERADRRIAELSARWVAQEDRPRARERFLRDLSAPEQPQLGWSLLLLAGWIAWTAGAFVFARRAIDEEDRVLARPARLWGTIMVLGFGCFVIGMALA